MAKQLICPECGSKEGFEIEIEGTVYFTAPDEVPNGYSPEKDGIQYGLAIRDKVFAACHACGLEWEEALEIKV